MKSIFVVLGALFAITTGRSHAETAFGSNLRQASVCIYNESNATLACFDRTGAALDKSPVTVDTSIAQTIVELRYNSLFLKAGTATKLYFVRD